LASFNVDIKVEGENNVLLQQLPSPPDLLHKMNCGELGIAIDTTYHPLHSRKAAKLSAGGLIELADAVVHGQVKNGFALIRPPGHHAEDDAAMGYCFYNNVAVAVSAVMDKHPDKIKKVLIIDWYVKLYCCTQIR
jgi:acetoin utilization deacetylase AcuC-like enzyme